MLNTGTILSSFLSSFEKETEMDYRYFLASAKGEEMSRTSVKLVKG